MKLSFAALALGLFTAGPAAGGEAAAKPVSFKHLTANESVFGCAAVFALAVDENKWAVENVPDDTELRDGLKKNLMIGYRLTYALSLDAMKTVSEARQLVAVRSVRSPVTSSPDDVIRYCVGVSNTIAAQLPKNFAELAEQRAAAEVGRVVAKGAAKR